MLLGLAWYFESLP